MARRRYPATVATALTALLTQSCGVAGSGPPEASGGGSQVTGGRTGAGGTGVISLGGGSAIGVGLGANCSAEAEPATPSTPPFADQAVLDIGEQRTFYSWTTDEQVAELRAGGELFSRSERPGMGRGLLFTDLASFAEPAATPAQKLAGLLGTSVFAKQRFAWTNPWATLLGFPGETYGGQLLQIELKPEAWIAQLDAEGLRVFDAQNKLVPIEMALASPERIGAIFYQSQGDADSSYCGTFSHGAVSFREFALGNLEMVQKWSLATPEIAARLQADVAELHALEAALECYRLPDQVTWGQNITCAWEDPYPSLDSLATYGFALGLPSELYFPSPDNLKLLIAALEVSTPTGEPLVVTPGK